MLADGLHLLYIIESDLNSQQEKYIYTHEYQQKTLFFCLNINSLCTSEYYLLNQINSCWGGDYRWDQVKIYKPHSSVFPCRLSTVLMDKVLVHSCEIYFNVF